MQNQPEFKKQAAALRKYLKELGLELSHQHSLEAIAKVAGFKNWKTMSASTPVAPVAQSHSSESVGRLNEITGPLDGALYKVPVTVEVTETCWIELRAHNKALAIEAALNRAVYQYPKGFEADEGNTKKFDDFYCPDSDSIEVLEEGTAEPVVLPQLGVSDFDADSKDGAENSGMRGEFWVDTFEQEYRLWAELNPHEPDNSNDEIRSKCDLTIRLEFGEGSEQEGEVLAKICIPYQYYGSDYLRGAHLEELFDDGDLLAKLYEHVKKPTKSKK